MRSCVALSATQDQLPDSAVPLSGEKATEVTGAMVTLHLSPLDQMHSVVISVSAIPSRSVEVLASPSTVRDLGQPLHSLQRKALPVMLPRTS